MGADQFKHKGHEITHCLRVMKGQQTQHDGIDYEQYKLDDLTSEAITSLLPKGVKFMTQVKDKGGKLLVYCKGDNLSRSTTMCCAYLMKSQLLPFEAALAKINEARDKQGQKPVDPNHGFKRQLKAYGPDLGVQK